MEDSNWGNLPLHLVDDILGRLTTGYDFVYACGVCKNWLSTGLNLAPSLLGRLRNIPFLVIPLPGIEIPCSSRTLYRLQDEKSLNSARFEVPQPTRCCGSSHGCLIFRLPNKRLLVCGPLPPASAAPILLPPFYPEGYEEEWDSLNLPDFFQFEIAKAVLSSHPYLHPAACVVAMCDVNTASIYFIRLTDQWWTGPLRTNTGAIIIGVCDIIFHDGLFYAIQACNTITRFRVDRDTFTLLDDISAIPGNVPTGELKYLSIASNGDIILINKKVRLLPGTEEQYGVGKLCLFKLQQKPQLGDSDSNDQHYYQWVRINTLGGDAIFIGDNHTLTVRAEGFIGCRPNSVYYTDDSYIVLGGYEELGPVDLGVFDVEGDTFSHHYIWKPYHQSLPPAIWILPTIKLPALIHPITTFPI